MQEEVEQRTVTLAINTTKMSANVLKSAIAKYLAYRKEKAREGPVKPCGKQSVKQLVGQNQGVSNIEITDKNIKDFERIARKYGVDFALKKDKTGDIPKYLRLDFPELRDYVSLQRRASNNFNQIARRVNSTGRIYDTDIQTMRKDIDDLWGAMNVVLEKLASIN